MRKYFFTIYFKISFPKDSSQIFWGFVELFTEARGMSRDLTSWTRAEPLHKWIDKHLKHVTDNILVLISYRRKHVTNGHKNSSKDHQVQFYWTLAIFLSYPIPTPTFMLFSFAYFCKMLEPVEVTYQKRIHLLLTLHYILQNTILSSTY